MNNLIQRLRAAWHFWKFHPALVIPPGYWTDPDARALSNFLASDSGVKFRNILVRRLHIQEGMAINDQSPTKFLNGVAWGIRAMIEQQDSLLQISPPSSEWEELTERQLEGAFRSVNR